MNTLLSRIKSTIQNDATLRTYIKGVQICSPAVLPDLSSSIVPWIGVAPVNSPEQWKTNAKKEVIHTVDIYAVQWLQIQETVIVGDGQNKGITDIVGDIGDAVRGSQFSSYLSKPADIINVNYTTAGYGDNIFLIVATITLSCAKIFSV